MYLNIIPINAHYYLYHIGLGIDHPSCPESSNLVRGWNYPCGTFCSPTEKYCIAVLLYREYLVKLQGVHACMDV